MAKWEDFASVTDRDSRIANVVNNLSPILGEELAMAAVGISGSESSFNWSTKPLDGKDQVIICPEPTTIVGIEPAGGDYGAMQLIHSPDNAKAAWEAIERGLITKDVSTGTTKYFAKGDTKAPNSRGQHMLFQVGLKYRDKGLIRTFSVGPTQMYMQYAAVTGGTDSTRGASWEDLYRMYHSWEPAKFAKWLTYLKKPPYPGRPMDETRSIQWLARICQAGCSATAATSYFNSRFKANYGIVL
jgi:hypothetical protein